MSFLCWFCCFFCWEAKKTCKMVRYVCYHIVWNCMNIAHCWKNVVNQGFRSCSYSCGMCIFYIFYQENQVLVPVSCFDRATSEQYFYWMLIVSQTASYEITLACLSLCLCASVCPSFHPSLNFLKIGLLVFVTFYIMIADHHI